jgi:hypothetical protein
MDFAKTIAVEMSTAPANQETNAADLAELKERLAAVRAKKTRVAVTEGLLLCCLGLLGYLLIEMSLDWLIELPWIVRCLMLLVALAGVGWLWMNRIRKPLRNRPGDDAVALMIERAMPVFKTRFIASVQLISKAAGHSLVRALVAETAAMARTRTYHHVVPTAMLRKLGKITLGVVVLAALFGWSGGRAAPGLLTRALLWNNPVPRKTEIINHTGSVKIGAGDDVAIRVTARGIVPSSGKVIVKRASGRREEHRLDRAGDSADFVRVIHAVQEPFTYTIKLNDATSPPFTVETLPRPIIQGITCEQVYPDYVKLPKRKLTTGELRLLLGSKLEVEVKAAGPVENGLINLGGIGGSVPMARDSKDPTVLRGVFEVSNPSITGFSPQVIDANGVRSAALAEYRIDVTPDEPPSVKIIYPTRREELVTATARMLMAFDAQDDYGLSKVTLRYIVNPAEGKKPRSVQLAPGGKGARRFEWKIDAIKPKPKVDDVIEFWFEVEDTNVITGPGAAASEHQQARVVTEAEKRADLANRLNETINGFNQVTSGQEQATETLGKVIFQKAPAPGASPAAPAATPPPR